MKTFISKCLVTAIILGGFSTIALADALDDWTSGHVANPPDPFSEEGLMLTGVTYGNGLYVAVGQFVEDDNGAIETSINGTNWTIQTTFDYSVSDLYDVICANGEFVASGWDAYAGENLWTSYDGTNWTSHTSQIGNLYRVIYANNLYVAVGDGQLLNGAGETNKNIYTSPDGTNWTAQTSGAPANGVDSLSDVAYGAGTFVAVGNALSTPQYFHTSASGTVWTRTTSSYPLLGNVSFCNGLFFAPVGPGTNLVSANGTTWSVLTNNTAAAFGRMIYTNGLYLALSGAAIYRSTDGTNWISEFPPHSSANNTLADVVFGNGKVVAVGYVDVFPSPVVPTAYISDPLVAIEINSTLPRQIEIPGALRLSYGIQYSSSLNPANWQTLTNFTLTNNPYFMTDSTATNSQRFYRAEWLP